MTIGNGTGYVAKYFPLCCESRAYNYNSQFPGKVLAELSSFLSSTHVVIVPNVYFINDLKARTIPTVILKRESKKEKNCVYDV